MFSWRKKLNTGEIKIRFLLSIIQNWKTFFPNKKTAPEIPVLSACSGLVPVCGYFPSSSNRLVHPTIEITGVLSLLIKDSSLGSGKPEKLPAIILRLKNRYIFPDCRVVFLLIGRREIYENAHI